MKRVANGSVRRSSNGDLYNRGWRRIIVALRDDVFATIRNRALAEQTSFAEQVRKLVQRGLQE